MTSFCADMKPAIPAAQTAAQRALWLVPFCSAFVPLFVMRECRGPISACRGKISGQGSDADSFVVHAIEREILRAHKNEAIDISGPAAGI